MAFDLTYLRIVSIDRPRASLETTWPEVWLCWKTNRKALLMWRLVSVFLFPHSTSLMMCSLSRTLQHLPLRNYTVRRRFHDASTARRGGFPLGCFDEFHGRHPSFTNCHCRFFRLAAKPQVLWSLDRDESPSATREKSLSCLEQNLVLRFLE